MAEAALSMSLALPVGVMTLPNDALRGEVSCDADLWAEDSCSEPLRRLVEPEASQVKELDGRFGILAARSSDEPVRGLVNPFQITLCSSNAGFNGVVSRFEVARLLVAHAVPDLVGRTR